MPRFPGAGRLEGKAALVTGGDSGIGRAMAVLFAREGADLAIVFLNEDEDAAHTARLVEAEGRRCLTFAGDIARTDFCESVAEETVKAFGKIDVLVNHAGEQHVSEALTGISTKQLARTFATNVFGYFYMTQAVLPHLRSGSAIVNTASVTAYRGSGHMVDYAATRGAIVSFTRSLATMLADQGIRVNGVAPGPIWTPLIPASFDAEHVAKFGQNVPLGRPGQPNEVAPAALFLACADSSYMTGQFMHPNGGEMVGS